MYSIILYFKIKFTNIFIILVLLEKKNLYKQNNIKFSGIYIIYKHFGLPTVTYWRVYDVYLLPIFNTYVYPKIIRKSTRISTLVSQLKFQFSDLCMVNQYKNIQAKYLHAL